ncbi:hypothetical protein BN14_05216 [Rhizoctonia solani AG-1 IB]|uniref:Uncharacterized protein n=1 Tax=Thanatephorus cucumeris (strain AG1-IB / isolate 7/3/14) TaxID=1108050 RepID=M5BVB1_THACB|nr:hypothetical protein BN14_05216 [Rhizoctonia solani AG-1 IB]
MPIGDPADQKAARKIESLLREAVARGDCPPVELDWFLGLPDRTRNSSKLLQAALKLTEPLLKHARTSWAKEKATERAREEHLAELRAKPRDLDCLRSPDGATWQGIGRRKRRCRKFNAIGQAFTARQGVAAAAPVPQPSKEYICDIHTAQACLPKRPGTPEGLREAAWSDPQLRKAASRLYRSGYTTPRRPPPAPAPPPAPVPPPPVIIRRPPSPTPPPVPPALTETQIQVEHRVMDTHLAYVMALGRWEYRNWSPAISLRQGAIMVLETEESLPGVLEGLIDVLFPHGFNQLSLAQPKFSYVRDFVLGWYAVAPDHGLEV